MRPLILLLAALVPVAAQTPASETGFVQLFNGSYAMGEGVGNWDGHRTLVADYSRHGPILDRPCAALLRDLKQRGLLDDNQ